jgi:hypothetical protein
MRNLNTIDPSPTPVVKPPRRRRAWPSWRRLWARLHRFSARARSQAARPEPVEADPIPADLASMVREAFPLPSAPESLRTRVTEICRPPQTAPRGARLGPPPGGRMRTGIGAAGWGWMGAILLILVILLVVSRQSPDVLAATIRATEAATAWHAVIERPDARVEIWWVLGLGSYERQSSRVQHPFDNNPQTPPIETADVDDLKHTYQWITSHVWEGWRNRVEVTPSRLADPKAAAQMREQWTGTGVLKWLQAKVGAKGMTTKTVLRDGRSLRQLTDRKNQQQVYVDPETDRMMMQERSLPEGGIERIQIDYPDPASIDRARFRFEIPKGACVVDRTGEPVRRLGGGEEDACVWQLKHTAQSLRMYVGENGGQWPDPDALLPATAKYQGEEPLQCPVDTRAEKTYVSYIYHRPSGPVAELAQKVLDGTYAAEGREPPAILARTVLLECRHHPGRVLRLYADGHVGREGAR